MDASTVVEWYRGLIVDPCGGGEELQVPDFVDRVVRAVAAGTEVEVRRENDRLIFRADDDEAVLETNSSSLMAIRMVCARLAVVLGGEAPPLYGTKGVLDVALPPRMSKARLQMINTTGESWFRLTFA